MKHLFLIGLLAFSCAATKAQNAHPKLDEKNGYKNLVLGDTISNIPKEKLDNPYGDKQDKYGFSRFLYKDSSALRLSNDIPLKFILVTFYYNRIYSIDLHFDKVFGQSIKDVFDIAYGYGYKENRFIDSYYYFGDKATLIMKYDETEQSPIASYSSNALRKIREKRSKEEDNQAASKL